MTMIFKNFLEPIKKCPRSLHYILLTVAKETASAPNNANKKVILQKYVQFTNCISITKSTQVDDAQYVNVVMPIYNLIEYSNDCSKTYGTLWQQNVDFTADNADNNPFKIKQKMTGQTGDNGTKKLK